MSDDMKKLLRIVEDERGRFLPQFRTGWWIFHEWHYFDAYYENREINTLRVISLGTKDQSNMLRFATKEEAEKWLARFEQTVNEIQTERYHARRHSSGDVTIKRIVS